jgi:hypothetical protein
MPLIAALTLITMAIGYVSFGTIAPWLGAVAAIAFGLAGFYAIVRLPSEALFWDRGARGERKTAEALAPLEEKGFVVLHDRLIPGGRGNIDHLAIGPSGIYVIETKNLKGSVEVTQDKLFISDKPRQGYVEQVYREAVATQIALAELLNPLRVTVTPVLCIHGAKTPRIDHAVAGVRLLSGSQLRRLAESAPRLLESEDVQLIAREADRRFRLPFSWEE